MKEGGEAEQVTSQEQINPNSIGELISIGRDLPTCPDLVYRSVNTHAAIEDLETSGVVRNKQSAGLVTESRWGEKVFWSKGAEGKYHAISGNVYVIVAPLSVAQERTVLKEDIVAIYTKAESGEVVDILKKEADEEVRPLPSVDVQDKVAEIRGKLGIK